MARTPSADTPVTSDLDRETPKTDVQAELFDVRQNAPQEGTSDATLALPCSRDPILNGSQVVGLVYPRHQQA